MAERKADRPERAEREEKGEGEERRDVDSDRNELYTDDDLMGCIEEVAIV